MCLAGRPARWSAQSISCHGSLARSSLSNIAPPLKYFPGDRPSEARGVSDFRAVGSGGDAVFDGTPYSLDVGDMAGRADRIRRCSRLVHPCRSTTRLPRVEDRLLPDLPSREGRRDRTTVSAVQLSVDPDMVRRWILRAVEVASVILFPVIIHQYFDLFGLNERYIPVVAKPAQVSDLFSHAYATRSSGWPGNPNELGFLYTIAALVTIYLIVIGDAQGCCMLPHWGRRSPAS